MKKLFVFAIAMILSLTVFAETNTLAKKPGTAPAAKLFPSNPSVTTTVTTTTVTQGANARSMEQRLLEMEQRQREFEQWYTDFYLQSKDRVSPFLGEKISFGGFFETGITYLEGQDMPSQVSANSQILGINIAADFNERIRFVTQLLNATVFTLQNQNNNPTLPAPNPAQRQFGQVVVTSLLAHAYLEYRKSEAAIFQMGIGYVPFGIAYQEREPVLFRRRNGPQLLNTSDASLAGIAFPLWIGAHVSGAVPVKAGRVGYNLYSFSPTSNAKTLGGGTRFWWSDSQMVTLGVSAQTADQGSAGTYYSYGTDANIELETGGVITEYARSVTSGLHAIESYYVEPYMNFADGVWVLYLAADYINNPVHTVGAIADPYEVWRLGGGVNWLPVPNTRFRLGYFANDYLNTTDMIGGQGRDYYSLDLSVGVAF